MSSELFQRLKDEMEEKECLAGKLLDVEKRLIDLERIVEVLQAKNSTVPENRTKSTFVSIDSLPKSCLFIIFIFRCSHCCLNI